MGQTEVTQAAYQAVMKTNPSEFKGELTPVENVTWMGAKAYCEAVGLRLPSEAEWEYAARAGSTAAVYGPLEQIAWTGLDPYDPAKVELSGYVGEPYQVAKKRANEWGLYDMLGNVWEWVNDWYDEEYYKHSVARDPGGPDKPADSDPDKVFRGGNWNAGRDVVRVSTRWHASATRYRVDMVGFRCAGDLP
jgi:formylglycine-generating enzyme required for sulfatase activity